MFLPENKFKVMDVKVTETKSNPDLPYTNLKLLADANKKLNLATDQVKDILDMLYRELTLITYPRTDSCRIDDLFVTKALSYLKTVYDENDLNLIAPKEFFFNKKKSKGQDGHAAITPVDMANDLETVIKMGVVHDGNNFSKQDALDVYELIYEKTKLALFKPAINKNTKVTLDNNGSTFETNSSVISYLGFKKYSKDGGKQTQKVKNIDYLKKALLLQQKTSTTIPVL
jgi:DNA topoisomerase IA